LKKAIPETAIFSGKTIVGIVNRLIPEIVRTAR